jgi:hypothetical protein
MALSDWTIYSDGGTVGGGNPQGIVFTDIITPIDGAGSLVLTHAPSNEFQSINLTPSTLPTGVVAGRLRTLIRIDDLDDPSMQENHFGILSMQNVENLSEFGTTNRAYGLSVSLGEGFTPQSIRLWKFTSGLDGGTGALNLSQVIVSVSSPFTLMTGSIIALEFEWRTEPEVISQMGGALLIGRVGQASNFSDLQTVITEVDTVSPFTTTVAESIFACFKNSMGSGDNKVTFDRTALDRIILN